MQKPLLYIACILLVVVSCSKDKFNTTPSLTLKSINPTIVPINSQLIINLEYTDKEGDISDSIFIRKIRTNTRFADTLPGTFGFGIPDIPEKKKGEIQLNLQYALHVVSAINPPTSGNPPVPDPDTLVFKFALRDLAGNISDTVTTEPIIVIR